MLGLRRLVPVVGCAALGACAAEEAGQPLDSSSHPVVYGQDDRLDYYQLEDPALRERVRRSALVMVEPALVDLTDPADVVVRAPPVLQELDLCEGERFRTQPRAGKCSATLVDDDVVLTAGHCLLDEEDCRRHRFVFDFLLRAPETLEAISADDVYACRRLLAHRWTLRDDDFSLVQLDRPVTAEREPAPVDPSRAGVYVGAPLVAIGFGMGVPAKADAGGRVLHLGDGGAMFRATLDAFEAGSGMGVFTADLTLVGSLSGGMTDYVDAGGCLTVNVIDEECPECLAVAGEDVVHVDRGLGALCALDWPSERLCGRPAVCGDAVCSGVETPTGCPGDCAAPACGDGVCDADDAISGCGADCGGPDERQPPPGWTCEPPYLYGQRDGCDCECGAPDLDCVDPEAEVFRCPDGVTCSADGQCVGSGPADPCADGQCSPTPTPRRSDDGCGCRTNGGSAPSSLGGWLGLALVAAQWRRRRRSARR